MINTLTFVKVTSTLPENTEHLNTSSDNNVYSGFNGNTHLDTNLQQVLSLMAGKKPREKLVFLSFKLQNFYFINSMFLCLVQSVEFNVEGLKFYCKRLPTVTKLINFY